MREACSETGCAQFNRLIVRRIQFPHALQGIFRRARGRRPLSSFPITHHNKFSLAVAMRIYSLRPNHTPPPPPNTQLTTSRRAASQLFAILSRVTLSLASRAVQWLALVANDERHAAVDRRAASPIAVSTPLH